MNTRREYQKQIQTWYQAALKKDKTKLLDEYCRHTGQNRNPSLAGLRKIKRPVL